jgi:hypothetical protein
MIAVITSKLKKGDTITVIEEQFKPCEGFVFIISFLRGGQFISRLYRRDEIKEIAEIQLFLKPYFELLELKAKINAPPMSCQYCKRLQKLN